MFIMLTPNQLYGRMTETVCVTMNENLAKKLRERKKETKVPMSVIVREALREKLDVEDE